ncbi:MAG: hypothetical protein WBO29_06240 [Albidovulum sp.]
MATYQEIQHWVKENHGFSAQPCWISEVKAAALGLPHPEQNRDGTPRKKQMKQPLTASKRSAILEAFAVLGIPDGRSIEK